MTTDPDDAAALIRRGRLAAFPTETVYGLGAAVFSVDGVERIFAAKGRPSDNPLIAHVADVTQIELLAAEMPPVARDLIDEFFPGPLTVILRKRPEVPFAATAGLDTVAVRMPRLELAHQFLIACGTPVVAPSANLSGRPSPTTWQAVLEDLDGRIDCILQGEPTEVGVESTVVDCTGEEPVVLRQGAISLEQIGSISPPARLASQTDKRHRSPGTNHRHYSPAARVTIVRAGRSLTDLNDAGYIGLTDPGAGPPFKTIVSDADDYARKLFEFFRECDRRGLTAIYCEAVPEAGIGAALMDRIRRAAEE